MLVLGTGPLASVMLAAKLGFLSDPNPNPVYHGMLAGLTFWPSIILIGIGVRGVKKSRLHRNETAAPKRGA